MMLHINKEAWYQLKNWPESYSKVSEDQKWLLFVFCIALKVLCDSLTK